MSLAAGVRLGPYEIVAAIGAGGMGELYRGRDPRPRRDVAITVLPPELSNDADRLSRFEQEARALALETLSVLAETQTNDSIPPVSRHFVLGRLT